MCDLYFSYTYHPTKLFGRLVGLFDLTVHNTPESIILGRIATKRLIEYHYVVLGELSLLVIAVKYILGKAQERLDAIAQVIAECDGMQTSVASSA